MNSGGFMTCDTWSENEKLESNTTPRFLTLCAGDRTLGDPIRE